ncbi:MAG TPA: DUF6166 domain-containing protein [Capsulimonadaceae bacterium]|nr:DUF6166 domain-containing protein [Capsulimonadaceae bacterium]
MKLYVGVRTALDRRVMVTSSSGEFTDYLLSKESDRDSQAGAQAGGERKAGPHLALAILQDHLADGARAEELCRGFEAALITTLPANFWVLSERTIAATLTRVSAEAR